MGRYARFRANKGSLDYEYKFWFAIQDSGIPWASEHISYYVPEYDEDQAESDELTPEQREIWKEWSEETVNGAIDEFSPEQREVLEQVWFEQYSAELEEEDIEEHEKEVDYVVKMLEVDKFDFSTPSDQFEEAFQTYEDYLYEQGKIKSGDADAKVLDKLSMKLYAYLAITTVCLYYQKNHGGFSVSFEV